MKIIITKTNRNQNQLIPHELIRNDEELIQEIESYCEDNKLEPIYIDGSVAIFNDHLLIAFYEDELILQG